LTNFRLDRKIVAVTGGASGIGEAIAREFAAQGACVHIVDIDFEKAQSAARQIQESGGQATAHHCDASDASVTEQVFGSILRGGLHILVNSVGMAHIGTLETTNPADFDQVFRVNVRSYYNSMRAAIPYMKGNGGGVILNIVSIAASVGLADRFAYSMSKGAVLSMTYSVARDYVQHKIRCNSISPARVHTPFVDRYLRKNYPGREAEIFAGLAELQPIGRMAEPGEVATLALFLCSDNAGFITGTDYPIDGGFLNLHG
jgi:NAD(P)-dependent dehydrogenase (short-subunit alcohol dehydrogenase family)